MSDGPTAARKLFVADAYADALGYFASVRPSRYQCGSARALSTYTPSQPLRAASSWTAASQAAWYDGEPMSIHQWPS